MSLRAIELSKCVKGMPEVSVYHVLFVSVTVFGVLSILLALYLQKSRGMSAQESMLKVSPLVGVPALIIGLWYRDLIFWGGFYLFLVVFVRFNLLAIFREGEALRKWWERRKQKAQQKANEDT